MAIIQTPGDHGKPSDGFTRLKTSLEPVGLDLGTEQTPVERFFVCSAGASADVDVDDWSLTIEGDAVVSPRTVGLDDLRALEWVELDAWIECAGNGRRLYEIVGGHERSTDAVDTQWTLGAMGQARWGGVRLADVLALADLSDDVAYVGPTGLDIDNEDGEPVRMCLPIDKARHPDTLVVLTMNGEPLVRAHGAPARLLVPGWVGAYSVKWLGTLTCSSSWLPSWRADVYYRRRKADGTDLGPATTHPVKSSLSLDWDAELDAGPTEMHGYARCGDANIVSVEWSLDDGAWHPAEVVGERGPWRWSPFRFSIELEPGAHVVRTRAFDADGNGQPEAMAYHPNTILWNAITPHPIRVR
ncbi:MAG: molybdopterin-dependent oxidoreductase [Actinomycetota bacterium]